MSKNVIQEIFVKEITFILMNYKMIYFVIIHGFNVKMEDNVKELLVNTDLQQIIKVFVQKDMVDYYVQKKENV